MRRTCLLLLFLLLFPLAAQAAEPTTIVLVRHAEKQLGVGDDPPLTAAGEDRANLLVHMLGTLPFDAVYSTDLRRTLATAKPLAEALGVEITKVKPDEGHMDRIVESIRKEHAGGTVLISGHSNTVPGLIERLGVAEPPMIEDYDYDNLFIVVLSTDGAQLVHVQFGEPTP